MKSLYLHFPFCRHLCNYCDFYKKVPKSELEISAFHELLNFQLGELKHIALQNGPEMGPWQTLYFGGGTPSLWGEKGATFFKNFLDDPAMRLEKSCEWTMEVNPGTWTSSSLKAWQDLGVNRFSLGVQSLDSRFLKLLDRVHSLDEVHSTLEQFGAMGVDYSVDFMLGLPNSKDLGRDIVRELEEILSYAPSHLSLYILTTRGDYVHAQGIPDEDWIAEEYLKVAEYLKSKGFEHYEVSSFALPGKRSRHNLAYWKCETVAALGPSGTGYLAESKSRFKWGHRAGLVKWEQLDEEQEKIELIYMGLRSCVGIELSKLSSMLKIPSELDPMLESWKERGLVFVEEERLKATSQGYLLLDTLMGELFRCM